MSSKIGYKHSKRSSKKTQQGGTGLRYHAHTTLGAAAGVSALVFVQIGAFFAGHDSRAAEFLLVAGGMMLATTMFAAFIMNWRKVPEHQTIARQVISAGAIIMAVMAVLLGSIACGF